MRHFRFWRIATVPIAGGAVVIAIAQWRVGNEKQGHQEVPASGGGFPSSKIVQFFHKASSFPSSFSCTLCSRIETDAFAVAFARTLRWLATSQQIPTAPRDAEIHRLSAEQSNTSLILGEIAVLKILRRVQVGRHPQTEMTRYLTEHGYANSPALFGEMVRVDADGTPQTLMIAERFVLNQGDAWQWTLDRVRRGIHTAALTGTDDEAGREAIAAYQPFATVIGKRLGELHAALASPTDDPAFMPERVEAGEAMAWATAA